MRPSVRPRWAQNLFQDVTSVEVLISTVSSPSVPGYDNPVLRSVKFVGNCCVVITRLPSELQDVWAAPCVVRRALSSANPRFRGCGIVEVRTSTRFCVTLQNGCTCGKFLQLVIVAMCWLLGASARLFGVMPGCRMLVGYGLCWCALACSLVASGAELPS